MLSSDMVKKMRELERAQQKRLSTAFKVPTGKAAGRKKLDAFLRKQRKGLARAMAKKPRSVP